MRSRDSTSGKREIELTGIADLNGRPINVPVCSANVHNLKTSGQKQETLLAIPKTEAVLGYPPRRPEWFWYAAARGEVGRWQLELESARPMDRQETVEAASARHVGAQNDG